MLFEMPSVGWLDEGGIMEPGESFKEYTARIEREMTPRQRLSARISKVFGIAFFVLLIGGFLASGYFSVLKPEYTGYGVILAFSGIAALGFAVRIYPVKAKMPVEPIDWGQLRSELRSIITKRKGS